MGIATFIFVFVLIWWLIIFMALPFGNAASETVERGHAASAPANPRLRQKLLWTTIVSLALTGLLALWIHYTGFSLHEWLKTWIDSQQPH